MFPCTDAVPTPSQPQAQADVDELARLPAMALLNHLWRRAPRDPLNLPNTKKLKYFNILVFFFLVPEFIPWVLGSHCVIYIYNVYIYIYILFFLVGFVFNSVIQSGGKPQSQGVFCLRARNKVAGREAVSSVAWGLRRQ